MKKTLSLLLGLILTLTAVATPFGFWGSSAGGGGGGGASLLFNGINAASQSPWSFADVTGDYYAGQEDFSDTAAHTVSKVAVLLTSVGDNSAKTFIVQIYTDANGSSGGGALGTLLGTSTAVSGPSLASPWSATLVSFNFATSVSVPANTKVHIVISPNGAAANNAVYCQAWHTHPSNIPGQLCSFSSVGNNAYPSTFGAYDLQIQIWGT